MSHNEDMDFQSGNPEVDRHAARIFEHLSKLRPLQLELQGMRAVARAADGLVEVSVGPTGNLLAVELNPRAMRLDRIALAEAIMAAYTDACAEAAERVGELLRPLLGDGGSGGAGVTGGIRDTFDLEGFAQDPMRVVRDLLERRSAEAG
jgi:DNA-binding protein YbaB